MAAQTITHALAGAAGTSKSHAAATIPLSAVRIPVNFADNPLEADQVATLIRVPKGSIILSVALYVHTAEGSAQTVDVGWLLGTADDAGANLDGYLDGVDINVAGALYVFTPVILADAVDAEIVAAQENLICIQAKGATANAAIVEVEVLFYAPFQNPANPFHSDDV